MLTRAVESPLVRGGLTLVLGVLTGNVLGFARVAIIAYLLGTHSYADALAVAMGPLDTLNGVLINSIVFAFVPMLTAVPAEERVALFLKLARGFVWVLSGVSAAVIATAPWLMRVLAPGLDPAYLPTATNVLRILALSTVASGLGAVHCALLYTERRFAPTAFYQAAINVFTIAGALLLWKVAGVYAFAIGYSAGACAQLAIVWFAARRGLNVSRVPASTIQWRDILMKPAFFVVYAAGLGLNITFTRAWATHMGPGMAAALDYCMRGVAVPMALLVNPISNSLLPEIARLRSLYRLKDALRLIDRTIAVTALVAVAGCGFAVLFREPAIRLLFQRGSFTAHSTTLVASVFFTLAPSLIGWSLIEVFSRSLFALDQKWPQVIVSVIPVLVNVALTVRMGATRPEYLGLGASIGLLIGFAVLFAMAHARRRRWLKQG
ncbi:MAG: oligosaccharide flippase family protein [Acidobacteriota bacterium]|nr:oligosaccharide flippase family protein [Acidobacteriota bacterium]